LLQPEVLESWINDYIIREDREDLLRCLEKVVRVAKVGFQSVYGRIERTTSYMGFPPDAMTSSISELKKQKAVEKRILTKIRKKAK